MSDSLAPLQHLLHLAKQRGYFSASTQQPAKPRPSIKQRLESVVDSLRRKLVRSGSPVIDRSSPGLVQLGQYDFDAGAGNGFPQGWMEQDLTPEEMAYLEQMRRG